MSANIVPISPYQVLGKWEHTSAQLFAMSIRRGDDNLLSVAIRLRELHAEMFEALKEMQRVRLEEQLQMSVKLIGMGGA